MIPISEDNIFENDTYNAIRQYIPNGYYRVLSFRDSNNNIRYKILGSGYVHSDTLYEVKEILKLSKLCHEISIRDDWLYKEKITDNHNNLTHFKVRNNEWEITYSGYRQFISSWIQSENYRLATSETKANNTKISTKDNTKYRTTFDNGFF